MKRRLSGCFALCIGMNAFAQDVPSTDISAAEKSRDKLFEAIKQSNNAKLLTLLDEYQKARLLQVRKGSAGTINKLKKARATAAPFFSHSL